MRSNAGCLGSEKAAWRGLVLPRWRASLSLKPHPAANEDQACLTVPGVCNSVNDLPVEMLQRIFTCCAEPRPPNDTPFLQVYPEWIAITYVNRYWRAVALNHRSLWGSVTPNLSPDWLKILIMRSEPAPVDAELRVGQVTVKRICLCIDEVIGALAGCTRLRSLRLVGPRRDVGAVLDSLRTPTPIRSLTLSLWEPGPPVMLPGGLFGGEAPIRYLHFTADRCIIAPPQLLRGVTHFTSGEQIPFPYLLDALRQMPALTHFTLQHCSAQWLETDVPRDLMVDMPHLTNLFVRADSPRFFVLLHEHLSLPKGAKRRFVLHTYAVAGWDRWARWFATFPSIIEAANGLQYAYLSGGAKEGSFRVWTGGDPDGEDAEFYFDIYWYGSPTTPPDLYPTSLSSPMFHLPTLCDMLGASTRVRNLGLEGYAELPDSFWWELLQNLQAVEQLEIHSDAVRSLYTAWDDVNAPAVLPSLQLQRVRLMRAETATRTIAVPRSRGAPLRGGFISRIMPSRSPRPKTFEKIVPITHRTANVPSIASGPLEIGSETASGLIELLHRGVAQYGV